MENMTKESFATHGENLLKKVKELIAEGNIRKIRQTKALDNNELTYESVGGTGMPFARSSASTSSNSIGWTKANSSATIGSL